ncbi:MAG: WcaI family glycosyltransferase [Phenylobacterium sp.]|nr:WcaI family glycosyltransferase [Phenylobacterium sp.]
MTVATDLPKASAQAQDGACLATRRESIFIYGINYAPEIAGVGRYSGEIGAYLAAEGHAVCVVTAPPHYPGWRVQAPHRNGWAYKSLAGAEIYRCPLYLSEQMKGIRRLLAPLSFAASSAPVALWTILRRRPSVVLVVEPTLFVAPVALLAARLVGARTVLHVQDLEVEAAFAVGHLGQGGLLARMAGGFDRAMARCFDRIVTISNRMAEKIISKGVDASKVEVVRNWVDLDQVRPDQDASAYRQELGIAEGAFVALYSGNLGAKQGVRLIWEAAERLGDRPEILFVVAGDGPMRPELEKAAGRLPNLRVIGFQPEARFGEFLSLANVHLLPQEREAADLLLPSKLGGMLASAKPVIVTADPGTELADFLGTSCHLTAPGDSAALAEAIAQAAGQGLEPETRAQRLALAGQLAKTSGIAQFAQAALFLQRTDAPSDARPIAA